MARILVTGGAGYIGAHACRALRSAGFEPICFDSLATGWRDAVSFGPFVQGDLLDATALDAAFAEHLPAAVLHFAALSLVGESVAHPERYWRNNVVGSLNLLEAMRVHGVKALVFSSTAATYGDRDEPLISEDAFQAPTNPYGASKLAVERMIADFGAAHGLEAVVFRYFNVAGAAADAAIGEQHRPETHLIPLVIEAALGLRPEISVFGMDYPTPDGTCIRDYLHVEDLVDAHVMGLRRLLNGGGGLIANLGVGRGYSVREVVDRARAVTGFDIPERAAPRRAGDPARLVCDGGRAMRELGWRPERSDLDRMIADAWAWRRTPGYAR